MKVSTEIVTKIMISDVQGLHHPVEVILQDTSPGAGSVLVKYGRSTWSTFWGAMGGKTTVAEFLRDCSADYIVNCMCTTNAIVKDEKQLFANACVTVMKNRRRRELSHTEARTLYDELRRSDCIQGNEGLLLDAMGEYWVHEIPVMDNPAFTHMLSVIEAVRGAMKHLSPTTETKEVA